MRVLPVSALPDAFLTLGDLAHWIWLVHRDRAKTRFDQAPARRKVASPSGTPKAREGDRAGQQIAIVSKGSVG
jgi:hypothetical protein